MNASCGRRLTEATFTCVRGFPYGRLCASRMDDTAETRVDQPRQRHGRQRRQCREPAMSPTSVMIAICFAPKERASLLVRSVAWVVLLSCCMIVCWGNHLLFHSLIEFFGEINQTVNVEILGSCQHSTRVAGGDHTVGKRGANVVGVIAGRSPGWLSVRQSDR